MGNIIRCFILFCIMGSLMGCSDRYRYPCQDPKNKNNPECSKEYCELSRECPNFRKK